MKNLIRPFVLGGLFVAMLSSPLLHAQQRSVAEIPFNFHVRNMTLPAGVYTVVRATTPHILAVTDNQGRPVMYLLADSSDLKPTPDPKMTFRFYDDRCFLTEIAMADNRAYKVSKSDLEKEIMNGGGKVALAYVPFGTR